MEPENNLQPTSASDETEKLVPNNQDLLPQTGPVSFQPTLAANNEIAGEPSVQPQVKSSRLIKALKICIILQLFFLIGSLLYGHFVTDSSFDQYILFLLWIFSGFTIAALVLLLITLANIRKLMANIKPLMWPLIVLSIIASISCATLLNWSFGFGFNPVSPFTLFERL